MVGSGPNGLAAAITLAQSGRRVRVYEAANEIGGSARTAALTEPGFLHDVCSAVFPLAIASPFFATLPLAQHGLDWVHSPALLAHPFDDGTAVVLERSVAATARELGLDGPAYENLLGGFVREWDTLKTLVLAPLAVFAHPWTMLRFGRFGLRSAQALAFSMFRGDRARALFAGIAAHSSLPLDRPVSAGYGLVLAIAGHAGGWPLAKGGSRALSLALGAYLESLGGEVVTDRPILALEELPRAPVVLCDASPRGLLQIAGQRLPPRYRRRLTAFHYGPAAYKLDYALSAPVPWKADACRRAATVHLGGTFAEIAESERAPSNGRCAEHPFVLLVQPTLFDPGRAPPGKHTVWAYCHVPNGSSVPMWERIEQQIERFAPGFRDCIIARSIKPPAALESWNPNLVGGDINGGLPGLSQVWARPTRRTYSTPVRGLYLCSSSTPPGGGVHGMCGYFAARRAIMELAPHT